MLNSSANEMGIKAQKLPKLPVRFNISYIVYVSYIIRLWDQLRLLLNREAVETENVLRAY